MTTLKLTCKILFLTTSILLTECNTINKWTGKSYTEKLKGKVKIVETKTTDNAKGKIYGTVTDRKTGEILKQANVLEIGTNNGTVTNDKGEFEISVTGKTTLRFSYIGFVTLDQDFNVSAGQEIKVDVRVGTSIIHDRW